MDKSYVDTVRLMLEAAPEVFRADCFAMKGGTALNLFVQDMPRLSVDIDVVYVPRGKSRDTALAEIASELAAMRLRLQKRGLAAEIPTSRTGDETKLFIRRGRVEVKIEINHVFRGTMLPIEQRSLVTTARDLFTTSLSVPTLRSELAATLTADHKRFLLGVVAAAPPWDAMSCRHLAELPAIQWKQQNLARLKKSDPQKFQAQTDDLQRGFGG